MGKMILITILYLLKSNEHLLKLIPVLKLAYALDSCAH